LKQINKQLKGELEVYLTADDSQTNDDPTRPKANENDEVELQESSSLVTIGFDNANQTNNDNEDCGQTKSFLKRQIQL